MIPSMSHVNEQKDGIQNQAVELAREGEANQNAGLKQLSRRPCLQIVEEAQTSAYEERRHHHVRRDVVAMREHCRRQTKEQNREQSRGSSESLPGPVGKYRTQKECDQNRGDAA